jgi:hypothetical protein
MSHGPSRIVLVASLAALAMTASQASAQVTAGQSVRSLGHRNSVLPRQPGPLLNQAAPFNRPPGPDAVSVRGRPSAHEAMVPRWIGSLLNESAPFNQPPGRS